jgi:hypothetical protein
VWTAETQWHTKTLCRSDGHIGTALARRSNDRAREQVSNHDEQGLCTVRMTMADSPGTLTPACFVRAATADQSANEPYVSGY